MSEKRNKIILKWIMIFVAALAKAQTSIGSPSTGSSVKQTLSFPTSPDAYSFGKVDNLPIDYFKGQANIDIPIYTIQIDNISLPISLKYNTGGIKQNEIASSVGLGWSLGIPNKILKSIEGMDDTTSDLYFKDFGEANTYFSNSPYDLSSTASDLLYNNLVDAKPDLYNYSLPTASGSFIINNNKGYTIPHEDLKITTGSSSIGVIDNEGNIFNLSPKNSIRTRRSGNLEEISSNLYLLDHLKTTRNNTVSFEYNKNQTYKEKTKYETKNLINTTVVPWYTYEDGQIIVANPPAIEHIENNWERLISKIVFPDGEIIFFYSGDQGEFTTADSQFRKDLNSTTGALALKRIIVKNKAAGIIKDVSFLYSYFESNNTNKIYTDYRLRLDRIKNNLDNSYHEFTYNETYALPPRNSNSDDYWGYFNSTVAFNTSIPKYVGNINTYSSVGYIPTGRDRYTNPTYAQMGVLTKVKYPTGAERKIQYESNSTLSTSLQQLTSFGDELMLNNSYMDSTDPIEMNYLINTAEHTYSPSYMQGKTSAKFIIGFSNGCYNGVGPVNSFPPIGLDPDYSGPVGFCRANWTVEGNGQNLHGVMDKTTQFEIPASASTVKLRLQRNDLCSCTASVRLQYNETVTNTTTTSVGGLRVKEIEDIDNANTSNKRLFSYSQGALRRKFHFIERFYRIMKPDPAYYTSASDIIIENLRISSSGNSYIGYNSSDIVTYSKVTEYNDLGEVDHYFTNAPEEDISIFAQKSEAYNDWSFGLPIKTVFRKGTDTLKIQLNHYDFSSVKNTLSGFTSLDPESIAFAADYDLVKFHSAHDSSNQIDPVGALQIMNYNPVQILGGKVELKQSKTKEYFGNGRTLETVTDYMYSDTDVNKPINLISMITTIPDDFPDQANYKYAHEKSNTKLINANMIGVPLETTVVKKKNSTDVGKVLSKVETKYDDASHLFPTSVVSYNLQNEASTEITYDQYDIKGNILQYTTKDGIVTSIIWGYNSTQPIAKITGVSYSVASGLATDIISASNTDASQETTISEQNLIEKLDAFRKQSAFINAQITTYTYDPLIGVRSITLPSGIREIYKYDSANRLENIKDSNGKLLKEFKYNYKH
ncbi:hypothetical protein LPB90_12430 [Chryseobacterium sp. LC2016-29]|uniref:hypothetical protein n=1 Tax=Chryseobacterium sp. LC2016-29 TaxID=2897331 RepID=UPI001E41B642|nr:hypothetical protein [Chryseobacterium sp. LC2016-29]MCD0479265.1 hypothetical protein [Chryseobacterium sp. LC2016-29]